MLDKYQQEIVNANEPRIIVEAGAGSGKTYTLIERIKKLINDGVEPSNIVCITFTRMARRRAERKAYKCSRKWRLFCGNNSCIC